MRCRWRHQWFLLDRGPVSPWVSDEIVNSQV
jgi:hypothetical protein